jgi:hypothetical protein
MVDSLGLNQSQVIHVSFRVVLKRMGGRSGWDIKYNVVR